MHSPARRVVLASFVVLAVVMAALFAQPAAALSNTVVISQVYGAGGNTGATYNRDYVELFNRGTTSITLSTYSIQYTSPTGTGLFSSNVQVLSGSIAPGQHFLVGLGSGAVGVPIPTPDVSGSISMGANNGKVILASTTSGIDCNGGSTACSPAQLALIADLVGFGTANFFEGTVAPAPNTTNAIFRGANGCTETDNNGTDFTAAAAAPRNTASPFTPCVVVDVPPSVVSTVPTAGATGVATNANITVTFTEAVTAGASSFALECPVATPIAFGVSGGGTTYTIDPTSDLPNGTSCAVTVIAANVTDLDGTPDAMASNYSWTFTTASATPTLSINDVTVTEGNAGTVTATFTVSLSIPAAAGGVTFDIATADGTGTVAGNDYVVNSLTGQTIPAGSSTYTFNVTVNGDTNVEPNETFFVNVTNVTGATVGDGQGLGTITNDDVALTPIHDIQGPGTSSPIVGASVTTRGVVTGVKFNNGFFMQEPDATTDADPNTSEGVFVFTSSAPTVAIGDLVQVTATVAEYAPGRGSLTELTTPTVVVVSSGNPLPTPIVLTTTLPDPAGSWTQLERLEGMRVSAASFTVTAPTAGFTTESSATGTSNGVIYGVVTGVPLPLREAGVQWPDALPLPTVPRWDSNPELIRVDTDGLVGGTQRNLSGGAILTDLLGPLDYAFDRYSILPQVGSPVSVIPGIVATPVATPLGSEFTVASYNLERFFDTVNDPESDAVLTPAAYANRLAKASLQIRNYLKMPDVLGVAEVEHLTTLQDLATKINGDAVTAGQPNPLYVAYLVEGNDVGGIDVGFLVKTAAVAGMTPRVEVVSVTQELDGTLFVNADASTETLNDRPPLRLMAIVHHANGSSYPVTIIVNHLRSMSGVDDTAAGSNGWATVGARVRAKRLAQAVDLATLVQARQAADATERIILVGDFNAFDVNDGYGDSMSTIAGVVFNDNVTTVPGDGTNLVEPDFINLATTAPPAERYSFLFDGTRQSLDHVLVNAPLVSGTTARRLEHPRINADFPETDRSLYGATDATRLSDHDPLVGFFRVTAFQTADLAVTKVDTPDPVVAGTNLTYTITVTNNGPDVASTASFSDTLPAGTTFVSLPAVAGWACTTPAVGAGGTVSCSNASFAVGSAVFTLTVAVSPATANGTILSNTATVTSAAGDGNLANNTATATTTVNALADLAVTMTANPAATGPGGTFTHSASVANLGPSAATGVTLTLTLPAGAVAGTITPGACLAAGSTVTCTVGSLAMGGTFAASVEMTAATTGFHVTTGVVAGAETDPNPANNTATATTAIGQIVATPNPVNMRVPVFSLGSKILNVTNDSPLTVGFNLLERPIEYAWARFLSTGPTWKVPAEHASDRTARNVPDHPLPGTPVSPLASIANLDFPVGLVYPWGIGFNTMADDMWVNDIAAAGGDGLNHRFLAAGTATGDTIDISSWVGTFAADMTYDPFASRLWQVNVGGANCIHELDPATKTSTGNTICPAFGVSQRGLAFDPVSDTFFAGSWNDGVIHRFDRNGDILESFSAGLDVSGLAYNPGTGHLFVLTNTDAAADLFVLDVNNAYATVSSFKVAGMAAYDQAGLEADCAGNLYAVNQTTAEVLVVPSGETGFCSFSTVPWLDETPKSGTLAPGATQPVTLDFITALQWPGLHQASLRVAGTNPFAPVDVPVNYTIAFLDVPTNHWADAFIHALAGVRVSRGCGEGNFCPEAEVDRAEMAILMVRAMHGPLFVPPAATGVFVDVPISDTDVTADYVEQLYRDGVVAGCAVGGEGERYYCPDRLVSRAEMSVFVSVGLGLPPVNPATGYFSDVHGTGYSWAEGFIETIFNEGITAGCGDHLFCPATTITRAQLAVWLVVGFNFPYLPPTP